MTQQTKIYRVERDNTTVRKLHMLARNGMLARQTVHNLFDANDDPNYIYFKSKHAYDVFKKHEYSPIAMYPH